MADKELYQTVSVDIKKALWKRIGIIAAETGTNKKEILEAALVNYARNYDNKNRK